MPDARPLQSLALSLMQLRRDAEDESAGSVLGVADIWWRYCLFETLRS